MRDFLRLLRKGLGLLLLGGGTVVFVAGLFISSLFRDGLGPDAAESRGFEAAARFMGIFWEFLLTSAVLWAAGALCLRRVIP